MADVEKLSPHIVERTKLLAQGVDRAGTAALSVGVFAPIAAAVYSPNGAITLSFSFVVGAMSWFLAAISLHLMARLILGDTER